MKRNKPPGPHSPFTEGKLRPRDREGFCQGHAARQPESRAGGGRGRGRMPPVALGDRGGRPPSGGVGSRQPSVGVTLVLRPSERLASAKQRAPSQDKTSRPRQVATTALEQGNFRLQGTFPELDDVPGAGNGPHGWTKGSDGPRVSLLPRAGGRSRGRSAWWRPALSRAGTTLRSLHPHVPQPALAP